MILCSEHEAAALVRRWTRHGTRGALATSLPPVMEKSLFREKVATLCITSPRPSSQKSLSVQPRRKKSLTHSIISRLSYAGSSHPYVTHCYRRAHRPFRWENVGCRALINYQPAAAALVHCNYDKFPGWKYTCLFMRLMNESALITYWNTVFLACFNSCK